MKLIKLLFVVITALVIANVTLTNRTVDESVVVSRLNREIETLQNENTILKAQVAESGSLGNLTLKLQEAGFVTSTQIVSVDSTSSVASR